MTVAFPRTVPENIQEQLVIIFFFPEYVSSVNCHVFGLVRLAKYAFAEIFDSVLPGTVLYAERSLPLTSQPLKMQPADGLGTS